MLATESRCFRCRWTVVTNEELQFRLEATVYASVSEEPRPLIYPTNPSPYTRIPNPNHPMSAHIPGKRGDVQKSVVILVGARLDLGLFRFVCKYVVRLHNTPHRNCAPMHIALPLVCVRDFQVEMSFI